MEFIEKFCVLKSPETFAVAVPRPQGLVAAAGQRAGEPPGHSTWLEELTLRVEQPQLMPSPYSSQGFLD